LRPNLQRLPAQLVVDRPAVSARLSELGDASGLVAILARENAELNAALDESRRELARAYARIIAVADRERRKLERDLHDGAQQRLVAIQIKLQMAQESALPDVGRQLASMSRELELAVEELRALARGIYPAVLTDKGLAAAVRSLATRAPISVGVIDEGTGRFSAPIEVAVYFCVLEATQNAIKHAGSDVRVTVVLGRGRHGGVRFEVTDDGIGMSLPFRQQGIGLISMRDRMDAVGGALEIASSPGAGTTVRGTVPVDLQPSTERVLDRHSDASVAVLDPDFRRSRRPHGRGER
jgi:signal transduction histidine kinase